LEILAEWMLMIILQESYVAQITSD